MSKTYQSFVFAKLPRTGLGNKLLVWARAYAFAQLNGLPLVVSTWTHIAWGAIMRNENKKRRYGGYFRETGWRARLQCQTRLLYSRILKDPEIKVPGETDCVYFFETVSRSRDFFFEIRDHREQVKKALFDLLEQRLQEKLPRLAKPFVGAHIRRGDFLIGSTITPLSFFIDALHWIREVVGFPCEMIIYTDAREGEMKDILQIKNVRLATPKEDILDLIELSRSSIVLTSTSSTFSFWASFLADGLVLTPPNEWHVPTRPQTINSKRYEGRLDPQDTVSKNEIKKQLLELTKPKSV